MPCPALADPVVYCGFVNKFVVAVMSAFHTSVTATGRRLLWSSFMTKTKVCVGN